MTHEKPASPTQGELAVKVKPLVWRKSNASDLWMADHPHGTEEIRFDFRADEKTQFGWFCRGQWCWYASLEAAKAAAQQDYETRILSALDRTTLPPTEGWRPIETAPKDGQIIWAWLKQTGIRAVRWASAEEWSDREGGDPDDYESGWVQADDEDEMWSPKWWMPYEAIPEPQPAPQGKRA